MDRQITIAVGTNRKSLQWKNQSLLWSEFCERLRVPQRTVESFDEFMKLSKAEKDELKDVGGFVGGALKAPRRKPENVTGRDLLTLDMDNIPGHGVAAVIAKVEALGAAAVIYSTRKHCESRPRLRVIVPTDRTMTPDEYEPCARKLAEIIGMGYADPTTFELARFMYWPSCSRDSEYAYKVLDAPFASVDKLLGMYEDWRDVTSWPVVPGDEMTPKRLAAKQEDPTSKKGVIGAFCRAYDIMGAMDEFIPGVYESTTDDNRYTYLGGTTTGGAIIYQDGKFLYSHHATDPCSGMLVNAWDLVRLHKFGDRDDEAKPGTPVGKLPSYAAMSELARGNAKVMAELDRERHAQAVSVFEPAVDVNEGLELAENWQEKLKRDGKGNIAKTTSNIMLIMENDKELRGKCVLDEFASRGMAMGALPWNAETEPRLWSDVDSAGMRDYLENHYGITSSAKVDDAVALIAFKHKVNQVAEYLEGLHWDGKKRIDTLLHDYLGAEQNAYTAEAMRKMLVAAVSRAVRGATKWEQMIILVGPQGCGKTTFITALGKEWYCDSLEDFSGKEAAEIIQGQWIIEVGELAAMNRSEVLEVKQFLSKKDDVYRAAYGRHSERYPRRCVFFGTSNESSFLRDTTGNRRFWPITVQAKETHKKDVWKELPDEVDQIWAEAYALWVLAESLELSAEAEKLAEEAREQYRDANDKEGLIAEFLERGLPENWDSLDLGQRRQFLNGNLSWDGPLRPRDKVCALEIWCECLGGDARRMKRIDSIEINNVLAVLPGWERNRATRKYGYCGYQRGYECVKS